MFPLLDFGDGRDETISVLDNRHLGHTHGTKVDRFVALLACH
jgi:hypothetical protein